MTRLFRAPMFWILLLAAGLRLAGLAWGLPAADGWDDDGFAPRNFLTALALTWKPGSYFTYPPLHAIVLALPSLPVAAWALAHAPSLSPHDVIATITQVPYMTYFAVAARLISLLMALGIVWTVGEMARLVAGRHAGLFAAGACALNFGLTYYGQVSNLDVPYLFWGSLALLWCMRVVTEESPRRFWLAALFAAAAMATKDQAYGLFLLSLPLLLALWFAADPWPRAYAGKVVKALLPAAVLALLLLLLVDGALTNMSGFIRRIAFLTGPASGDYAAYPRSGAGLWALAQDMADWFGGASLLAALLALTGLVLHARNRDRAKWVAGFLPVLAILSFTLCFNLIALRTDARFLLPQGVLACVYIGIAAAWLVSAGQRRLALGGSALIAVAALLALHGDIGISAAMLKDPRYDAQAWLGAHLKPGDLIETFGQNAYLPRFPAVARVVRPGPRPVQTRNPLPGVTEIRAAYDTPLRARFIVVNDWWLRHYTQPQSELGGHRSPSRAQGALFGDAGARQYFTALAEGRLPYRLVHAARATTGLWTPVHIHESLNETILIFERMS